MPETVSSDQAGSPAASSSVSPAAIRKGGARAVRRAFLEFYEARAHAHVPSSPAVPVDDPTLLFTNAGMNQFKPLFLGTVDPTSPLAGLRRAVNSQKCIRAGGKHNDLEDVGRDTYHHTFFEMLGTWSFGDYFKADSIQWAWDFLTGVLGLPPDRFYATYFGGNDNAGLAPDEEARQLWLRHLPPERVLPGSMKDNFWEMGDTGPCGPCSEIHFDRIGDAERGKPVGSAAARALVNSGDPDVLEVWNHVFIQFDRQADSSLRPLPAKHVDTGMGFERLVSVLQNVRSNYDTDVFAPLFVRIQDITRDPRGYHGKLGEHDPDQHDTAYRVIADHIRTLTIAITDGAQPSNEGRGYVLRRILRRAVRFGRQKLGARTGFMASLVPAVVDSLGDAFPELAKNPQRVADIIREEEESFGRTLDRGIKMFDEITGSAERGGAIKGPDAFALYDTYGFPLDLTQQMAEERGLTVDVAGFEAAMEEQKERSRASAKFGVGAGLALSAEAVKQLQDQGLAATDDQPKFEGRPLHATLRAIWTGDGFDHRATGSVTKRDGVIGLVTSRTPFYAEMGGQVADTGRITLTKPAPDGRRDKLGEFRVEDVKAFGGYVLHIGHMVAGELHTGDEVELAVDAPRRQRIAANHTATHLLNLGLRLAVGPDCDQKGSLVTEDKLRFDFSHNGPVDAGKLSEAERIVRGRIAEDLTVHAAPAALAKAREVRGLRAVFGEAYPDPVRVVSIGRSVADLLASPDDARLPDYSIEFCGGTHLHRTGEARAFVLVSEEGVAKGIRRITGLTGQAAASAIELGDQLARALADVAKLPDARLEDAVKLLEQQIDQAIISAPMRATLRAGLSALQERIKQAKKAGAADAAKRAAELASQLADRALQHRDAVCVGILPLGGDRNALQAALNAVRTKCPETSVMLISPDEAEGVASVMAATAPAHIAKGLKAGDWVREVCALMGGKGGGKPELAQGSGASLTNLHAAADRGRAFAAEKLA